MRLPIWATPSRQLAAAIGGVALILAIWLGYVLPSPFDVTLSAFFAGAGALATGLILERATSRRTEQLAAAIGEVKVRLAQTNIKLDHVTQAMQLRPMSEADAAPARVAISELTAEVGILGGLVRDMAQAMSAQEQRVNELETARPAAPVKPSATASAAPSARPSVASREAPLVAQTDHSVQQEQLAADAARGEAIAAALSQGQVELYLQPVMQLPQRKPVGYEALARLRLDADTVLLPAEFLPFVERRGIGPAFDALVLTRVLTVARYLKARGQGHFVSCNLCSSTWGEARAIASLTRLFEAYRAEAGSIIVEVPQRVFRQLDPTSLGYLGGLSVTGVRFALDQVHDLRFDPAALRDRGIRHIKLGLDLMTGTLGGGGLADIAPEDLVTYLGRNGIEVIVEKLGDNRAVADAMELAATLGQGLALGPPRQVRAEILTDPLAAARQSAAQDLPAEQMAEDAAASLAQAQAEPQPERMPYRAFLRRASA